MSNLAISSNMYDLASKELCENSIDTNFDFAELSIKNEWFISLSEKWDHIVSRGNNTFFIEFKNHKSTNLEDDSILNPDYTSATVKPNVSKILSRKVEADYVCVISSINRERNNFEARVYDPDSQVMVMEIAASLSDFEESDAKDARENTIFYWSIGSRTVETHHKNGKTKKTTENFSEFKLRRIYSPRSLFKRKIKKITDSYLEILD